MSKIFLAVGHGIRPDGKFDPGAVSKDGRWTEQTAGDIVVHEAAKLLRQWGASVRDEAFKDDPNFVGTSRDANAWGADILVEIHHDWNGAPDGAFGHWYTNAGKAIADAVQKAVGEAGFKLRPSWHKRRTDLSILKTTKMPALLYEVGKIGQHDLSTEAGLRRMGVAVATGIAAHQKLRTAPAPAAPPTAGGNVNAPKGPYSDVPGNHPHVAGIKAATDAKLMTGRKDGTFNPDGPVTRGQLATVLERLLKR